jgi:hypothetical protein
MLQQRHVIRFLVKEGICSKEILDRVLSVLHKAAIMNQVLFVGEVRQWREDLSDEEGPGGPPTAGLNEIPAYGLE